MRAAAAHAADGVSNLANLRQSLTYQGLDGFILPRTNAHLGENVAPCDERLAWLTGFRGSRGWAVVLADKAALFVPGLYVEQAQRQSPAWEGRVVGPGAIGEWLCQAGAADARIGYDPWLHPTSWAAGLRTVLEGAGCRLVALESNPVDSLWKDRPALPDAPLVSHPVAYAGRASSEKRREVATWLVAIDADAVVISALDSVAWLLNIRGGDIPYTPVAHAFVIVRADGSADLFTDPVKCTPEVIEHLGTDVRVKCKSSFAAALAGMGPRRVAIDADRTPDAVCTLLSDGGAEIVLQRDPVVPAKAIKNPIEVAGHRSAQVRDSVALCRFLHWLSLEGPTGAQTEISAANKLLEFREASGKLRGLVSKTISAFGHNAALPHYRPSEETNLAIVPNGLYMVDSGGQYLDGTTDVTRTVAIGTPNGELCDRFTRVLKGHIAIARATFPKGTSGSQLDILARGPLWEAGLDFPHFTGHGVGSYLCVHEGPQRIFNRGVAGPIEDEPLAPGMILSNEPAYYKEGEYGMRLENCVLVEARETSSGCDMLGFDTVTLAPFDGTLIVREMLTPPELAWLDAYHRRVADIVGPHLDAASRAWLVDVTNPL